MQAKKSPNRSPEAKARARIRDREKYASDPEARERHLAAYRRRYAAEPEKYRRRSWKYSHLRKYGITLEARDEMEAAQDGRCAICGSREKLHLDHNHETGSIRELLCHKCNKLLGFAQESELILGWAIDYIRKHNV